MRVTARNRAALRREKLPSKSGLTVDPQLAVMVVVDVVDASSKRLR